MSSLDDKSLFPLGRIMNTRLNTMSHPISKGLDRDYSAGYNFSQNQFKETGSDTVVQCMFCLGTSKLAKRSFYCGSDIVCTVLAL